MTTQNLGDSPTELRMVQAFTRMLSECLAIQQTDSVLLIGDETFRPFDLPFAKALANLGIFATQIFFPLACQERWVETYKSQPPDTAAPLPDGLSRALLTSDVVINVLGGHEHTLDARRAVLQHPRPAGSRFAHMPGISLEVLDILAVSPISQVLHDAELVAWALGESSNLTIISTSASHGKLSLNIAMDTWDNAPLMSPGVIFPGSWGNVLPGETFCCPRHPRINGDICINGSVPGKALSSNEELHLHFDDGRLTQWSCPDGTAGLDFIVTLRDNARLRQDANWSSFAELGFGLNPSITELNGNALFDEKAAGTIHIAIGDNAIFGHPISSRYHRDLVIREPTVHSSTGTLIDNGHLCRKDIEAWRDSQHVSEAPFTDNSVIFLRKPNLAVLNKELFRCNRIGGRVSLVRMGPQSTGHSLAQLQNEMDTYQSVIVSDFIRRNPSFGGIATRELLNVLYHYRALAIQRV